MIDKIECIANYIITFLLGGDEFAGCVTYASKPVYNKRITILRSNFFDQDIYMTEKSMPKIPLCEWRQIPLLFGNPMEDQGENGIVLHADIVASSFFLISRYEEYINHDNRDTHGRFCGAGSLPSRGGFLERPIVDEYGRALRNCLREQGIDIKEPTKPGKVYLTHDVDIPFKKWDLNTALRTTGGLFRKEHCIYLYPLLNYFGCYRWNPYDTFDWMMEEDMQCKLSLGDYCEDIYFLIGTKERQENTENYIFDKKIQPFLSKFLGKASHIGMHLSYKGGEFPSKYAQNEKNNIESVLKQKVTYNRNHYLRSLNPDDFLILIQIGITDDFTMGYADRTGFRLGTAKCVCWIDAKRLQVTELRLHPLIVMDRTLDEKYMDLDEREAKGKLTELIQQCRSVSGDFCALFHNTAFMESGQKWMRATYHEMIQNIRQYWLQ